MSSLPDTRPSRLFIGRKSTAASRKIYQRNADESRFLKLPPELRNRIYRLVLGGRHIHISEPNGKVDRPPKFVLCLPDATVSLPKGRFERRPGDALRPGFDYCTNAKGVAPSAELSLSLLRVSRHVYDEAALVPFAANTFVLHSSPGWGGLERLPPLERYLMPSQLSAIQIIALFSPNKLGRGRPPHNVDAIAQALTGLKKLQLVIELGLEWRSQRVEAHIDAFLAFEQSRMQSASVVIYSGYSDVSQSILDRAEKLERKLSMPKEAVDQDRKQAEREELARADREWNRADIRARRGLRSL